MKTFESEIKKYAEKTRLKALEREAIRDRVLSYMEYHPLPKKHEVLPARASFFTQVDFIYFPRTTLRVKLFAGFAALALLVGVPLAAERSVPGDVLYLVKTGVTEGIRTQLATNPYAKVALETKLMERRIGEARLLASEGKLTEEVEAQIAVTVKEHADAVQSGLAEIREDNADEGALAEIVFNSALEVQSAVLNESGKIVDSSSVEGIIDAVNTVRDEVASDANPTMPSFDGLTGRIESETTRAYELFETIKESATAEEISDIERRLADINRKIVGAKELKAEDETGSVNDLIDALGLIQKLIAFMTDIDIRETVALETLVPVELTPEERMVSVQKLIEETLVLKVNIEEALPIIPDERVVEKVSLGLTELTTTLEAAQAAVTDADIDTAEILGATVRALAEDLRMLAIPFGTEVLPVAVPPVETVGSTTPTTTVDMVGIVAPTTTIIIDYAPLPPEVE